MSNVRAMWFVLLRVRKTFVFYFVFRSDYNVPYFFLTFDTGQSKLKCFSWRVDGSQVCRECVLNCFPHCSIARIALAAPLRVFGHCWAQPHACRLERTLLMSIVMNCEMVGDFFMIIGGHRHSVAAEQQCSNAAMQPRAEPVGIWLRYARSSNSNNFPVPVHYRLKCGDDRTEKGGGGGIKGWTTNNNHNNNNNNNFTWLWPIFVVHRTNIAGGEMTVNRASVVCVGFYCCCCGAVCCCYCT